MQQLFFLLSSPLSLLDGWIEPLVPPRLAIFGRLPDQKGTYPAPLVESVLHHGCLEDLILCILPVAALYWNSHLICESNFYNYKTWFF